MFKLNECDTVGEPAVPNPGMGEIKFPQNGEYGSGDVVCGPKKKRKKPYTQKPANTVLSFDEFFRKHDTV